MKLTIVDVEQGDFGSYKCMARNSLGETDGNIKLYREYLFIFPIFSTANNCYIFILLMHKHIMHCKQHVLMEIIMGKIPVKRETSIWKTKIYMNESCRWMFIVCVHIYVM